MAMLRNRRRNRKVVYRKKRRVGKGRKSLGSINKVYRFKRMSLLSNIIASSTGGVVLSDNNTLSVGAMTNVAGGSNVIDLGFSKTFALSDVQQSTDFTSLYDQYQITGVKMTISWLRNSVDVNLNQLVPTMLYTIDNDNSDVPISQTELRERNSTKRWTFHKPLTIYIPYPKHADAVYNTAVSLTNAYSAQTGYVDCANPSVEHYGLKGFIRGVYAPPTEGFPIFEIDTVYYLKFKGVI